MLQTEFLIVSIDFMFSIHVTIAPKEFLIFARIGLTTSFNVQHILFYNNEHSNNNNSIDVISKKCSWFTFQKTRQLNKNKTKQKPLFGNKKFNKMYRLKQTVYLFG